MDKVLIVDDDAALRRLTKRYLQRDGFEVLEAEDGNQALTMVEEHGPGLILLDVMMPGMDGFEVCKRLHANCRYRQIYIIFLSGRGQVADKVFGLESGGDDYLSKPFDHQELLARVHAGFRTLKDKHLSSHDSLTGLFNRFFFNDYLHQEIERAERYRLNLTVALMDIDHFKQVNDQYGHFSGDQVLVQVGEALGSVCRKIDIAARWGGEEFIILLPETDIAGARVLAERLRKNIAEKEFPVVGNITISIGLANYSDHGNKFLEKADEALYLAKDSGRNQVQSF